MLNKKGAMFGLDARIALAIFGALSVISGAALYSAIEKAKVTSLLTEMSELGKATEAYMLDTGQNLPLYKSNESNSIGKYSELVTSTVPGWKGPYFPMPVDGSNTQRYDHPVYGWTHLYYMQANNTTWGEDSGWAVDAVEAAACGAASYKGECSVWVFTSFVPRDLVKALDKEVDSGDGGKKGNVRYFYPTGAASDEKFYLFVKVLQKM